MLLIHSKEAAALFLFYLQDGFRIK